ncbi:hypothetical protein BH24ACT20_BH24ACT20_15780 [soil metagenome]
MSGHLISGLAVPAVFAVLAYTLGVVGWSGALGGFGIAAPIYLSLGWRGFAVLALFVVGGSVLTRLGYRRKELSGTAESGGGRRGARNAFANGGVPVLCALLAALTPYPEAFAAAFVAALGAAFADTSESEIGQLYGAIPRLITTMAGVPPGTDGAVSLPGTLAGVGAAGLTAALGFALGLIGGPGAALLVAGAAVLGTVADSLIGALMPRVGNELTNVVCTLTAAVLAFALA